MFGNGYSKIFIQLLDVVDITQNKCKYMYVCPLDRQKTQSYCSLKQNIEVEKYRE